MAVANKDDLARGEDGAEVQRRGGAEEGGAVGLGPSHRTRPVAA